MLRIKYRKNFTDLTEEKKTFNSKNVIHKISKKICDDI